MSQRTILSPGVEIREVDLSLIAPTNVGTNIFIAGYAQQGYTDEVIKITSRADLDQIYGTPTNSAERYFYHGIRELLNSPANIYTYRLPYGEGNGAGFGSDYSALVYPVKSYGGTTVETVSSFDLSFNYASTLSGNPLSGASFTIQTSTGVTKKVVYALNGATPYLSGDIVVNISSNALIPAIITTTSTVIGQSATGQFTSFTPTSTSLKIALSGFVPLNSGVPAVTQSVFAGLNDPDDVLSISSTLSTTLVNATVSDNLNIDSGTYVVGEPVHVVLTETEYQQIQEGSLFTWGDTATQTFGSLSDLGGSGIIVLNKSKTAINSQFEGYYIGIADNFNIDPSSNYDAIIGAKTISNTNKYISNYTSIPTGNLQFGLSAKPNGSSGSISQIMENLTDYDIDGRDDDDLLNVGVFKLRKSLYATESYKLDYVLDGAVVGSIDSFRTRPNQLGGPLVSFFLENEDTNDRNIEILVNPNISNKNGTTSMGINGIPNKKIRVLTHSLVENNDDTISGIPTVKLQEIATTLNYADNIYPVGTYDGGQLVSKQLGSIPGKLERALESVKNDEIYDIDVVLEAGLGTIHVITEMDGGTTYYDDTAYSSALSGKLQSLRTSKALDATGEDIRANYSVIFNTFENFCNLPSNTGGRGDCIFIADPIRHIMVVGKNTKVLSDRNKNFQTDIYWAMRHQFELENTSYACAYANWAQVYDEFLGDKIWIPFSVVAGATFARNDAAEFPWSAPAGYTRGLVSGNVVNIAITPNQKQRDELYKSNLNPVLFSPAQGMAIFGQKTFSRKPSAFDRINVRRCFLALERPTKKASVFFVFEPNTEFTRTRFVNTLTPIFEYAKNNQGIYDYLIVCDERNNTPQVIDSNEMRADIYIKPVRTAEYILVSFIATRTDANFEELI